jgi:hypothetical protein
MKGLGMFVIAAVSGIPKPREKEQPEKGKGVSGGLGDKDLGDKDI